MKKNILCVSSFFHTSDAFGRWALLLLLIVLIGCKDNDHQLPDPESLFPTPKPEYIVVNGDTIPVGYSKTIDDLTRLTSLTDDVDLLTIHGTSGSKVWKKFYASVLQAYVMDSLATIGDVTISSPSSDQVLKYNGSVWVNGTVSGSGDVTTAQLADSTAAVRADFPTPLTQEQVEDFIGAMFSGNTETLITVTYQDSDGTIDLVVNQAGLSITESQISDLSHTAANTVSGAYDYITLSGQDIVRGQVDMSTDVTGSANGITTTNPTGGTNTLNVSLSDLYNRIVQNTLLIQSTTPGTPTTITVNQQSRTNCITIIDMTTASAVSTITLSMSNTAAGVITLSFENTIAGMEIDFPSTFLDQTGAAWDGASTYSVTKDFFMSCYSLDGINWKCK